MSSVSVSLVAFLPVFLHTVYFQESWASKGFPFEFKSTSFGNKIGNSLFSTGTTEEALANADKLGFNTNLYAKHPFIKDKKIPIYFANFVLMDYGTGAVFGCPAHDQRDFEFAKNIISK